MPDFAPEIESWTYQPDGTWSVVVSRDGREERRWTDTGRLPVDLFREASEEIAAKARKKLRKPK